MKGNSEKLRERFGSRLIVDEPLSSHCQFGSGGNASLLIEVDKIEDLILAVLLAQNDNIPYRVIGFGGALLFSDKGYDGLVIVNRANRIVNIAQSNKIICDSGVAIAELVYFAAEKGLGGLEQLCKNNGTIGGLIYNNGAESNTQIGDYVDSVTLLTDNGKIVNKRASWVEFGPRATRLMRYNKDRPWVILTAVFQMQNRRTDEVYSDICRLQSANKSNKATGILIDVFKVDGSKSDSNEVLQNLRPKDIIIGGAELDRSILNCVRNKHSATSSDARKLIESLLESVDSDDIDIRETIEYFGSWQ